MSGIDSSDERDISELINQGSLGTPRARQIRTIGENLGRFMESDLMELCLDFMANRGSSFQNYREDLGNGIQRYFVVEEREDEAGYLELEVRFTKNLNMAGPEARYRIQVVITEQET